MIDSKRARKKFTTSQPDDSQVLLTSTQLADRWQVSPETIKRRRRTGELLTVIVAGNRIRFRLSDVKSLEEPY